MSIRNPEWVVAIHGGAGSAVVPRVLPEIDQKMDEALDAAFSAIDSKRSGMEVVVSALRVLEECEYFDAGYGSLIREDGSVYCDISLVDGSGKFYAIAGLDRVRFPSELAFCKFVESQQSMFTWTGEHLNTYIDSLPNSLKERIGLANDPREMRSEFAKEFLETLGRTGTKKKGGTVGCIVRNPAGEIFVGTSTGGTPNAPIGRIGDTPIVGMGSFADNSIAGISATGWGECFIALASVPFVAAGISTLSSLSEGSVTAILQQQLRRLESKFSEVEGGMLCVTPCGIVAYAHNTEIMPVAAGWKGRHAVSKKLCKNGVLLDC